MQAFGQGGYTIRIGSDYSNHKNLLEFTLVN